MFGGIYAVEHTPLSVSFGKKKEIEVTTKERNIEQRLIEKLKELKYIYREDIRNRDALNQNFRQKFEELNQVKLTDNEFSRLMEQIITPNVFSASQILRQKNSFEREDGTPLNYTLVNLA